ncbi:PREDICTED: recQ-mediated genome instability protein 1 [Lupinus angustifolius]|uniref:recQ-mediated genome instability protein 1 n=1 Tax=Lupinus angustifolius TaxID=3871 RepID=UPI00092E915B|nr:PREDICTED: recQ-mediated genome instability protein 1 [Lupinus angustifolius]
MSIRHLRLEDYEDDEEGEEAIQILSSQSHTTPPHQLPIPNRTNLPSEPLQISSDDDFVDVPDDLSPPSPQPSSDCPIADSLRRLGLGLKREWLRDCLRELEFALRGFSGFDVTTKAKLCFEQFLFADMNFSGSGVLPPSVDSMHRAQLPGPYVLQVDEIVNITCPLRGRYNQAPPGAKRCLKLSMTDGIQRVFGMEYRPIQALEVCAPAGLKVVISNVHVRRGLLMLVPETIEILGGLVEQLDAARKRLVDELNKPPRGKRTKNGALPPLASRASLAAWPSSVVDDLRHNSSTLRTNDSVQVNQGAHVNTHGSGTRAAQSSSGVDLRHRSSTLQSNDNVHASNQGAGVRMNGTSNSLPRAAWASSEVDDLRHNSSTLRNNDSFQASNQGAGMGTNGTGHSLTTEDTLHTGLQNDFANSIPHTVSNAEPMNMDMQENTNHVSIANSMVNQFSSIVAKAEEMHIDTTNITRGNSVDNQTSHIRSNIAVAPEDTVHITRERRNFSTVSSSDDFHMFDASDDPLIFCGDEEVPFTYLASLSAKWAAMKEKAPSIQGKIKCFLTGVKGFQYKKRTTYELQAYVDDGSLISEILIDHDVVQQGIGYSPQEVTAALSSPDTKIVHNMKETMRRFQGFLANFEGVMLVELNRKSSLPLALEMSQGCPQSDAWLLLRRLKSPQPAQVQRHIPSDPIELSP